MLIVAKCVLALIMLAVGFICLYVFKQSRNWISTLTILETEADIARDNVMMQATMTRGQLAQIHERLTVKKEERHDVEVIGNMIKQAMPVVSMLLAKETSLVKWGFAGANLLKTAYDYFSKRGKN